MAAATRAAPLLAERRDRAREADREHAVEQPHVDPELERVRRGHAEQLALEQPPLDLAPLRGGVAGAVRREPRIVPEPLRGEAVDQLGGAAALREAERAQALRDQIGHQPRRLPERARPEPELLVGQRRVPERHRPFRARRAVVADHGRLRADQPQRELARVRDRRRGQQELRLGAVDPGEPPQPSQDVADVRAEDAAVDVRFVHDHEGEVRQHVAPAVVVWQDADVEHVGVREDHVRPLANLPAALGRGVAVVDRGPQARQAERGERAQLVLRKRLGRVEVERPLLRLAGQRVEHRQVERERLPGGRAGRDDQVLAPRGRVPRFCLVRVELLDSLCRERLPHARVQLLGQRRRERLASGLGAEVGQLLALEQISGDAHRRHLNASPNEYSRSGGSSTRSRRRPASRKACRKSPSGRWLAPTCIRSPDDREMPGALV